MISLDLTTEQRAALIEALYQYTENERCRDDEEISPHFCHAEAVLDYFNAQTHALSMTEDSAPEEVATPEISLSKLREAVVVDQLRQAIVDISKVSKQVDALKINLGSINLNCLLTKNSHDQP